jgi:hypothetical protein
MRKRTTKRGRRTIKTHRRTIKTRRRTIKRRPRKIMVGGEETEEVREIRKIEEWKRKDKETYEEKRKREKLDKVRAKEGKEIIENLKSGNINISYINMEKDYNIYIYNACINKIVEAYGNDNYQNNGLKFINEFIPLKYSDYSDLKINDIRGIPQDYGDYGKIIRDYPLVYLSYIDKKDTKHVILKDELPFIWPWDWDDYIMSYDFFKKFNTSGQDYDTFIASTEYQNALYKHKNRFN